MRENLIDWALGIAVAIAVTCGLALLVAITISTFNYILGATP